MIMSIVLSCTIFNHPSVLNYLLFWCFIDEMSMVACFVAWPHHMCHTSGTCGRVRHTRHAAGWRDGVTRYKTVSKR